MPLSYLLPRGAYFAPCLDPDGQRLVILINAGRRLLHHYSVSPESDPDQVLEEAFALLDVMDPPQLAEAS